MAGGQEEYPRLPTPQTDQSLLIKMDEDPPTQTIKKEAAPNPMESKQECNERFASMRHAYESAPNGSDEKAAAFKRWQAGSRRFRDGLEQRFEKFGPFLAPPGLTRGEADTGPGQEQKEREKHLEFIISLLVRGYQARCSSDAIIRDSGSVHLIAAGFGIDDILGKQKADAMYNGDIGTEPWDLWMDNHYAEAQTKWRELKQARQTTEQPQQQRAFSQPSQSFQEQLLQQSRQPQPGEIDPMRLERLFIQTSQPVPKQPRQQAPSQQRQQPSGRQQLHRGSLEHLQTAERGLQEAHRRAQDPQQQRVFTPEQLERYNLPKSKQSHVGEWVRQQQQAPPPPPEQQSMNDDQRQLRIATPPLAPTTREQVMQGIERRLRENQERQTPAPLPEQTMTGNQRQKRAASSPLLPPLEQTSNSQQPQSFLGDQHRQVQPSQPVPPFLASEQPQTFLVGRNGQQQSQHQAVTSEQPRSFLANPPQQLQRRDMSSEQLHQLFLTPEIMQEQLRMQTMEPEEIRESRRQRRAESLLPPMMREQPPPTLREHQQQLQQQQQNSTARRRTYADIYRDQEARRDRGNE